MKLCLRPRFAKTGMWPVTYPYWLRPKDPLICRCGAAACADSGTKEDRYWLAREEDT